MESLHGHNYRLSVILRGRCNQYGFLVDFRDLKSALRKVIATLNEAILIPTNEWIRIGHSNDGNVLITYQQTTFSLPAAQIVQLPILNITSELLAQHIAEQLLAILGPLAHSGQVSSLTVDVSESEGQSARYTITCDQSGPR